MKHVRKNKFILGLLLTAVLGLAVFSIGGEYLHDHLHHHPDEDSRHQCPVYQFQAQAVFFLCVPVAAIFLRMITTSVVREVQVVIFRPDYFLPEFRAPPQIIK